METANLRIPWNKGKLIGQKSPLKLQEIYAIRTRLQLSKQARELAMFDLAIDSKLRACDLVNLRVRDVSHGSLIASRAMVMQQKTKRPVQFEITEQTRNALTGWIDEAHLKSDEFLFPSRLHDSPPHLHSPICAYRAPMGEHDRTGSHRVRHLHDAPNQSHVDLPTDKKPARGATAARP